MILLITRQDKCDLIFRRQLLSCFVSLRSLQRMDNNYSAQLNFFSFSFFYFLFSHKIGKNKTQVQESGIFLCLSHNFIKNWAGGESFQACSDSSWFYRLDTRSKLQDGWWIVTVYTRRAWQDSWYLHCGTVILHVEHSRQRNQAPVCSLTSTMKDSDTVRVQLRN